MVECNAVLYVHGTAKFFSRENFENTAQGRILIGWEREKSSIPELNTFR
jgi:hypothetical protein